MGNHLTDAQKRTGRAVGKRSKEAKGKWYSDNQKLEAVKCWLITGNLKQTAAALSINYETVKVWRYSTWWKEMVDELKSEDSIQLTNRLKKVASNALTITEDRLENGEFILNNKTGEIIRKPVTMKDAHKVAMDLTDQAEKLDRKPQELMAEQKTQDVLDKLQAQFEKFANNQKPVIEVTDVQFVKEDPHEAEAIADAIHDEREARLQEREALGEDPEAESSEGSSPEDEGTSQDGEGREGLEG